MSTLTSRDLKTRFRLLVQNTKYLQARMCLSARSSQNTRWRMRLLAQTSPVLGMRLDLHAGASLPNPSIPAAPAILSPGLFTSPGPALPLLPPFLPYQLNGIALDTPIVCSAPSSTGLLVVGGSSFTLAFQNPSASTQNQLVPGLATMTFALVTGEMVTGPVLLQVTSSGSITIVNVITQADISVNRWVVSSQFA